MPLGMEVGLGPGDFVLDVTQLPPPQKKGTAPNFRPMSVAINGWIDQDATWYGSKPRPRRRCVRWGPSSPSLKEAQPPSFRPMFIVAKRLDGWRRHFVPK